MLIRILKVHFRMSNVISSIFLTFQITLFDSCQNNIHLSKRQLDCVVDTVFTKGTNIKYLLNPIDSIALLNVSLKKYNSKTDTFFYSISDCRMIPKFIYHTTDELFLIAGSGSYRELYRYTIENKQVIKEITSFDFLNGDDYEYFYFPYINKDYVFILMSNNFNEFCSINTKYRIKSTEITNITVYSSKMIIEKQNKSILRISLPIKIPKKFQ